MRHKPRQSCHSTLSIELNHVGARGVSAFHQSLELGIRISIRSRFARQGQKESTEGRDRNAFGIIEHWHRAAAAIDDWNGNDPAVRSSARSIALWCAGFSSD